MRRHCWLALSFILACGPAAGEDGEASESASSGQSETAGESSDASGESGESESGDTGAELCGALSDGVNEIDVNGVTRTVILSLPSDIEDGGPWPVVFNWHGLGDSAANMSGLVAPYVDGPEYSFIGVTPEDNDFVLDVPLGGPVNMDWEIFTVNNGSPEVDLFDAVLACLDERYGVDEDRVHSMGFSLGGIVSDLLGTTRGDEIASIATYSGGYWSNPDSNLGLVNTVVSWPVHDSENTYAQLFVHGGETDTFSLGPAAIQFNDYATADHTWLTGKGHAAYICDHGGGHTAPPAQMGPPKLLKFLADHPRGVDSPYASELPADWPDYCDFAPPVPAP